MIDINSLINKYIQYIHANFEIEEIDKKTYEITTPFLDSSNDYIVIYALINGDKIKLSDDSDTLNSLALKGMQFNTEKRQQELEIILNGFGIQRENNELFVEASVSNFASKQHNILQALISVNDMFVLANNKISSFFFDDVARFLDSIDARYISSVSLEGKSHLNHKFDFIISKSKKSKERLIKLLNNPKKDNLKSSLFSFLDLQDDRVKNSESIIILNDSNITVPDDITQATNQYGIKPILWSQKEAYKNLLSA